MERSSPTLVASIGSIQKEANSDIRDRLVEIEDGCDKSLVEIHEGYRVEFGSLGRSGLRGCAEYKRYGP